MYSAKGLEDKGSRNTALNPNIFDTIVKYSHVKMIILIPRQFKVILIILILKFTFDESTF